MGTTLPLISINRLRMEVDGDGVTTLVAAKGCPLSCEYCLNKNVLSDKMPSHPITVEKLIEEVQIDDLYFRATGGGVVFGGGESLIHADFIKEFAERKPAEWKLLVETSLNVPEENVRKLIPYIDYYIVDIKDMNAKCYKAYTGKSNRAVLRNLRILAEAGCEKKIRIRIPLIPNYNTPEDCKKSIEKLQKIGDFDKLEVFSYVIREDKQ